MAARWLVELDTDVLVKSTFNPLLHWLFLDHDIIFYF